MFFRRWQIWQLTIINDGDVVRGKDTFLTVE